jgi:hypothetical protein
MLSIMREMKGFQLKVPVSNKMRPVVWTNCKITFNIRNILKEEIEGLLEAE